MKILIAPLEFKGTLSATEAAHAIARGVSRAMPDAQLELLPLADGGPGTVDALITSLGGSRRSARVHDPLGRLVDAEWALVQQEGGRKLGVIEMAAASGLWRLGTAERSALHASTLGTGELIAAALDAGCEELLIGAGGSATNDGGAGVLTALGARIVDGLGEPIAPGGASLVHAACVDLSGLEARVRQTRLVIATDVTAPLLGATGATHVFGPQKGATPAQVERLEEALTNWASVLEHAIGRSCREVPGAGAAGGLAFALLAVGAHVSPGFEVVASAVKLDERLQACHQVLTGEGRFDAQTALGKGPWRLAEAAARHHRPVTLFAGCRAADAPGATPFAEIHETSPNGPGDRREAAAALEACAERWAAATRVATGSRR